MSGKTYPVHLVGPTEPGQPMSRERVAELFAAAMLGASSPEMVMELCREVDRLTAELADFEQVGVHMEDDGGTTASCYDQGQDPGSDRDYLTAVPVYRRRSTTPFGPDPTPCPAHDGSHRCADVAGHSGYHTAPGSRWVACWDDKGAEEGP